MSTWYDEYQVWLTEDESLHNAQLVADHFGGTDWTPESISALCGNMRHESSINPDMYEYGYDWADDRGYGLVQWTPRSKYWDWATARGLEPRVGESQLKRIDYEVDNDIQWIAIAEYDYMTFTEFRTNAGNWSVDYLTEAFTWSYERPNQQAGEDSMPERKAFANKCYTSLDFSGNGGGGTEDCIQLAILPIDVLYITQGEDGSTSHTGTLALDLVGWSPDTGQINNYPYTAPFDCECVHRNDTDMILGWVSKNLVMCADGKQRNIMFRTIHDDTLDFNVGDVVTKGTEIGQTGTGGNTTGDHLHLDVYEATTYDRSVPLHCYDVFAINGVEVYEDYGYPWKTSDYVDCSNTGGGGGSTSSTNNVIGLLLCDALNGWKF